ncbi:MAG TPA: hypothetical protein VGH85_04095 [Mycobacteriales bacterium]
MIILSLLLVLASAALLAAGVVDGSHPLIWASIGASVVAAGALAASIVYRRNRLPETGPLGTSSLGRSGETQQLPAMPPTGAPPTGAPIGSFGPAGTTDAVAATEPAAAADADTTDYPDPPDEPAEEDVSAPDALRVVDSTDEVLVVDGRPRYHVAGCPHLSGKEAVPLSRLEAREAGFTPCSLCAPDATFADAIRRRAAGG